MPLSLSFPLCTMELTTPVSRRILASAAHVKGPAEGVARRKHPTMDGQVGASLSTVKPISKRSLSTEPAERACWSLCQEAVAQGRPQVCAGSGRERVLSDGAPQILPKGCLLTRLTANKGSNGFHAPDTGGLST